MSEVNTRDIAGAYEIMAQVESRDADAELGERFWRRAPKRAPEVIAAEMIARVQPVENSVRILAELRTMRRVHQ